MPNYRCYFVREDGSIFAVETLAAENDKKAVADAAVLFTNRRNNAASFELWHLQRFIYRHKPDKKGDR